MTQPRAADDFAMIRARMKYAVSASGQRLSKASCSRTHRRALPELDIGRSERSNCARTGPTNWVDANRMIS